MAFDDIDEDDRSEWRMHPTTIAFLQSIIGEVKLGEMQAITRITSGPHAGEEFSARMAELGGQIKALRGVLSLAGVNHGE